MTRTSSVLIEICDADIYPNTIVTTPLSEYHIRKAARGLVIRDKKIALLHVTKGNYHKLPGGGIEIGEGLEEGFKREVLEETGCECTIDSQNGITIEYWDCEKELQLSYIFIAKVVGEPVPSQFTENEKNNGFELKWVQFNQLFDLLKQDNPSSYEGKFIQKRDRAIVDYYKDLFTKI